MTRVLPEYDAETAGIAAQATNGYHVDSDPDEIDIRRERSKRLNHQHTPRRNRTHFTRSLGPYSRDHAIVEIDQRTKEAQLMRRVRDELTAHVGGHPTAVERLLIERAVMLSLRCAQIDIKIMSGEVLTQHDNQHGLAWNNGLRRCLVDLGLQPRQPVTNGNDLEGWVASRAKAAVR